MKLVPWVPTPKTIIDDILRIAGLKPGDVFYDLGCGDGRVLLEAARKYKVRAVGIEIDPGLCRTARETAAKEGLDHLVEVVQSDFREVELSDATVVYMYLLTSVNRMLREKLSRELKAGTRVVTLDFPIPEWKPVVVERVWDGARFREVYLYIVGVSDAHRRPSSSVTSLFRGSGRRYY